MSSHFSLLKVSGPSCCWRRVLLSGHPWASPGIIPYTADPSVLCLLVWLSVFRKVKLLSCRRAVWGNREVSSRDGFHVSPGD